MKTLILLIDFYGHPALTTDRYSDNVRYSYLTENISSSHIDKKQISFYSGEIDPRDLRLQELKHMAILNGFNWVNEIPKDIDNTNTQIIVTGTNTSGCVFNKKGIGAYHWYRHKYKTKIYLPMCAEYEKKGINDFERNMLGLASLYKKIYKERCFNIKICENMNDLNLPISI